MKVDVLVAEIGSTITLINAFSNLEGDPAFIGQGQAPTSIADGDVNIGISLALESLKQFLNTDTLEYKEMLATSSAAGGLKMTVHGLVYDMTVRAAREAALGAGANLHLATAGRISKNDLNKLLSINPNLILIAGGVEHGDIATAIFNADAIANLDIQSPVIYAGNSACSDSIVEIFERAHKSNLLSIAPNVYPKVDSLNVEPVRAIIQDIFELHIVHAAGMENVRKQVSGNIMPTPGAVMEAAIHLKKYIGDLMIIDVGGATTDIHSVTEGNEDIATVMLSPEPFAKRTVEGDLGVYVNMPSIVSKIGEANLSKMLGCDVLELSQTLKAIPDTDKLIEFVMFLTEYAVKTSVFRHAGKMRTAYDYSGKHRVAEGRDLTAIKWIIGTGGALTRLPRGKSILESIIDKKRLSESLVPHSANVLIDSDYILASLGILSKKYPDAAIHLMKNTLKINTFNT